MSLFAWLLLGLLAGFLSSHSLNHRGEGMILDILLGIVAAIIGGWIAHLLGMAGVTRLNLCSLMVAVGGSVCWCTMQSAAAWWADESFDSLRTLVRRGAASAMASSAIVCTALTTGTGADLALRPVCPPVRRGASQ